MKKHKLNISEKLRCPCCGQPSKGKMDILSKQIESLVLNKLPWYAWQEWVDKALERKEIQNSPLNFFLNEIKDFSNLYDLLDEGHFEWACDECYTTGRAIEGQIEAQTFCDHPPYLAYYDKERKCDTCSKDYVFSKEEQKFWYEELKFWVQSIPQDCKECRKEKRRKKLLNSRLSELLGQLNKKDQQQLTEISQIFFEMKNTKKGKYYAALAKKAARNGSFWEDNES